MNPQPLACDADAETARALGWTSVAFNERGWHGIPPGQAYTGAHYLIPAYYDGAVQLMRNRINVLEAEVKKYRSDHELITALQEDNDYLRRRITMELKIAAERKNDG